jgi:hypothetical protein
VRHPLSRPYALGQRDRIPGCSAPWQSTCSTARAAETVIGLYKTELINLALRGLVQPPAAIRGLRRHHASRTGYRLPSSECQPRRGRLANKLSLRTHRGDAIMPEVKHAAALAAWPGTWVRDEEAPALPNWVIDQQGGAFRCALLALCPLQGFERTPSEVRCRSWPGPS